MDFIQIKKSFFKEGYIALYDDIAKSNIDPWEHYCIYGRAEGRHNGVNPPAEAFFDLGYLTEYVDVAASGAKAWEHYCLCGKSEGRDNGMNPPYETFLEKAILFYIRMF